MPIVHLPDRTLIAIGGADARDFLERLITNDVETMVGDQVVPSALLTPQGKIMFDFLICETAGNFLIDIRSDAVEDFLRRMTMYRMRAAVTLETLAERQVNAAWGPEAPESGLPDSRFPSEISVKRIYGPAENASENTSEWNRLRIANGVVESGSDYTLSDVFPHDVLMDINGGVSFSKGCFVGQEVVSRMKHRNTARRRVVTVNASATLPEPGTSIEANGKPVGTLGSVVDQSALAIVRVDRAGDAFAAGHAITAGDVPVTLSLPAWSGLAFPQPDGSAQPGDGD